MGSGALILGSWGLGAATPYNVQLPQEAYVWQRVWNEPVREAVEQHGTNFASLIVLNAEVSFKQGHFKAVRVPLDYGALTRAGCRVGLALRIGPYAGPFEAEDKPTAFLTDLAAGLIAEAKAQSLKPSELQIDFDCAESKLEGYRVWVEKLRRKLTPMAVTITVLPSWLGQGSFEELARAADGYVLQVHSLERPRDINAPFALCEPAAAKRAVELAGKLGIPFRVALPTYGYLLAFDREGRFAGLSAEGPNQSWAPEVQLREVRSDPMVMAQLVQSWTANHPPALKGIIWYRLPIADDILNWRWPTLSAIISARSPRKSLRAEPRRVEAGLLEISLVNDGELDISSRLAIEVRWSREAGPRLVAGDGLRNFELVKAGSSTVQFQNKSKSWRLPAGETQVVGWLRLSEEREVKLEIVSSVE